MNDFLNEIHQIARFEPSIVERIDEDLDLHAKRKKLLRLTDAQFLAGQTPDLGCWGATESATLWKVDATEAALRAEAGLDRFP